MKKVISILLFMGVFAYIFFLTENNSQSWRFSDEDAHTVAGYFVKNGKKPYKDVFLTHQPLMYITSGAIQKVMPRMQTSFEFIKRHREYIYLYSLGWNIIYFYLFGPICILFALFFETIKFHTFGNQFLGEVFAMYPFGLLIGLMVRKILYKKSFTLLEKALWGVSTFIAWFSLMPMWPALLILNGAYLYFEKKKARLSIYIWGGLTAFLFTYIPLWNYLRYTVYGHIFYFIPMNSAGNPSILGLITLPLQFILPPITAYKFVVGIFVCYLIYFSLFVVKKKEWLILILVLLASNTRVSNVQELWGGFHLLPWVVALMTISFVSMRYLKPNIYKLFLGIFFIGFLISLFLPGSLFLKRKDVIYEHYMGFTDTTTHALLLNSIKKNSDRLAVFNVDSYLYWMTGMAPATVQIEYYDWHFGFPEIKKNFISAFSTHPPEFIVDGSGGGMKTLTIYTTAWKSMLAQKYIRLKRFNKSSDVYVLKERAAQFSKRDFAELKNIYYSL